MILIGLFALAMAFSVGLLARRQPPGQAREIYRWAIRIWVSIILLFPIGVGLELVFFLPLISRQFLGFGVEAPGFHLLFDWERYLYRENPVAFALSCTLVFLLLPIVTWWLGLRSLRG